jgi:hypothetical protein
VQWKLERTGNGACCRSEVRKRVLEFCCYFQWGTPSYNSIHFARTSLCT